MKDASSTTLNTGQAPYPADDTSRGNAAVDLGTYYALPERAMAALASEFLPALAIIADSRERYDELTTPALAIIAADLGSNAGETNVGQMAADVILSVLSYCALHEIDIADAILRSLD